MRNAVVIIYSQGVLQASGIRRFGNGVSQLSPLRPVLGNGDPLIELPLYIRFIFIAFISCYLLTTGGCLLSLSLVSVL